MSWKVGFVALLVLCLEPLVAFGGGRADIVTFSTRTERGVKAVAQTFDPPATSTTNAHLGGVAAESVKTVSVTISDLGFAVNNRCSATNLGGGFSYSFGPGLECASFAAPPTDEPRRGRGRRPRPPSPEQIALALADRVIALAEEPELRVAPSRIGLTGLDSFFWLARSPRPIQAIASAGAVTVTAEAHPVQFVWDFGDGADHVTRDSGRRWRRGSDGSISHTYETAGRYDLAAEIVWQARWRIGAGAWRHLGYFSTSDARRYPVREIVAMLARPGWRPR